MAFIHADLPEALKVTVRGQIFYNMEPKLLQHVDCTVFGVSSYPGQALTFSIKKGGAVFSDVPGHLFGDTSLGLRDVCYHNCPSGNFTILSHSHLRGAVWCYLKHQKHWALGRYLFTLDWHNDNELVHGIQLESRHLVALPSHKVLFQEDRPETLPDYLKLRQEWILK